ncbi:MAG TPA: RDD family protein [Desulfuromonadales bacterium]|nr:RDD family protein [Desulfuromonadales bacterium]
MEITCPHCGFSRQTDPHRIPDRPVRVTCPSCAASFRFEGQAAKEQPAAAPRANEIQQIPENRREPALSRQDLVQTASFDQEPAMAERPKAGFWIRFVAYFFDGAIVGLVQFLLGLAFGLVTGLFVGGPGETQTALSVLSGLLGVTISLAYGIFFIGYCGQTPGKMITRVKVVRTDGTQITYGRAFLREVIGKFLSGILLCIGYLMVAFDSQKQGLHDKIADTYVIKLQ